LGTATICAGAGGSGVVIVRYAVPAFTALTEPNSLNDSISQTINFDSGLDPIAITDADTVDVISGSLPPGITFDGFVNNQVTFTGEATEAGEFTFTLRAYASDPTAGAAVFTDREVSVTVSAVIPGPPTSIGVFDRSGDTIVSLTPPTAPGSDTVFYEGTIDGGSNWTTLVADGGDWRFPDFDRSAQQAVQVRARNQAGSSDATSPVTFPQFMLNNDLFRLGGGGHNGTAFSRVASIGANGQTVQPFYFDSAAERWAKMTYRSAPFDFALGFGTGNEPPEATPYDASKNWTGATVYGTFQNPDPFESPVAGSASVVAEDFSCVFQAQEPVCMGTGTVIASADFELGSRTVTVINRYTMAPNSKFLEVVTSVRNPDGSDLENVNVWVGTRDDWVGIENLGGVNNDDDPKSEFGGRYIADLPQKFRGTITDGFFQTLTTPDERATALVLESLDGAGLFFSASPNANVTIAPCCESLQQLADATAAATPGHSARGFENAVTLNPIDSAIATPLGAASFKPTDPNADFFQTRRTDLRDAGYALHFPLGSISSGETNGATWFLGGAAYTERSALLNEVSPPAPTPPSTNQSTTNRPRPPMSEALAPTIPGTVVVPRPATTSPALTAPRPPIAQGPVVTGNQAPRPSNQPTATIGGVPTPISQSPIGTTGVRVTTGSIDVGVRVNSSQQGAVRNTPQGTPELSVVKGQQTVISGSGMAPGSTVQAFLPLNGSNAIELGRIQADATGAFSGAAVLNTPLTQAPLPVGRQVLQILGVDNAGNQTVVNMTINIAQPPPQPEINRDNQEIPALAVGQSMATEAGIPVPVTVTAITEDNQTLIEGVGWTMSVSGGGDDVLTLVRDEPASVSGGGFMPFTRVDIWLFSDPTLLGTAEIDENGEFNGVVNVDGNVVAAGEHTLQLQGIGEDGYVRAANLGVLVGENSDALPAPTTSASFSWLLWTLGIFGVLVLSALIWWFRRQVPSST
jgi:hypothetical protein